MDAGGARSGRGTRPVQSCADPAGPVAGLRAAAAAVGGVRVDGLDAEAALEVVLAARWAQAAALAVEADGLARLEQAYPDGGLRGRDGEHAAVVFELMTALGVSQRSAANRLSFGWGLAGLPGLGEEARLGGFDVPMLLMVLDKVGVLPEELRREAVDRLLEAHRALPGGLTRPQAGRLLGRIVAGLDPAGAERRQAGARRGRRVFHHPGGAAGEESTLGMTGPAERVAICFEVVDALARAILAGPHAAPGLTLEQARFDALEWLITGHPAHTHPAWPHPDTDDPDSDTPRDGDTARGGDTAAADDDIPPWETRPDGGVGPDADADAEPGEEPGADGAPDGVVGGDLRPGEHTADDAHDRPGGPGAARHGAAESTAINGQEPGPTGDADAVDDTGDADGGRADVARAGDPGIFAATPALDATTGGGSCGCGRPRVRVGVTAHITVALSTLLGLDHAPGELAGLGPVPASVARELAAAASTWRRLLTDPVDGHLITQTIRTYRPTAAVREFVLARAGGVCAWRGCTARHGLQIDHDIPWPHGPTGAGNNLPLHQPHHDAKTCGAWCHRLNGATGGLTQT
ncbi:MAG TPA: DUF222 domain-containing protein, partial [Jiangellales bacterium]|nr:DUF222 domain-containing protein [Jiangellales bacterium]